MKYLTGWLRAFLLTVIFASLVVSARDLRPKRVRRQFPFLLDDETTTQHGTSSGSTPGMTDILPSLNPVDHSLKPQSITRTTSLPRPTPLHPSSTTAFDLASSSSVNNLLQSSTESSASLAVSTSTSSADPSSASKSSSTWQIIGVAVTCVTIVGVVILSTVFFDQWTRFLRDVVCGKKTEAMANEELLTEKKNWAYDIREGRMSNIRYPAQIFSPPLDSQPLKRTVRSSFLKRFSHQPHSHRFHRLSGKNGESSTGVSNAADIHPSINVGDIYPVTNVASPHNALGLFGGMGR